MGGEFPDLRSQAIFHWASFTALRQPCRSSAHLRYLSTPALTDQEGVVWCNVDGVKGRLDASLLTEA